MIKFLFKRILAVSVFVSVAVFFIDGYRFHAPLAILLGSAFSLYKLNLWNRMLKALSNGGKNKSAKFSLFFVVAMPLTLCLMTALAFADVRLLLGFSAGYLILTLVIMVNAFTEGLNITKNNWGEHSEN